MEAKKGNMKKLFLFVVLSLVCAGCMNYDTMLIRETARVIGV